MDNEFSITDDFLEEDKFTSLGDLLFSDLLTWFFYPAIVYEDQENTPGFLCHTVFKNNVPRSKLFDSHIIPILKTLKVSIISRIQINLNWRLPQPYISIFHTDTNHEEQMTAGWTTSILYINTNNGYTELETGEKIESVANRLVSFPANVKHRICTQTDTQRRILINFNYLKEQSNW